MSKRTKVGIGQLGEAISDILNQYSDEVVNALPEATQKATKETVKILKDSAPSKSGKYKSSFKYKKTESTSSRTLYEIYSSKPGLTHLLEHGHVKANQYGRYVGMTTAYPHWAPAEEKGMKMLEDEIKKKVEESG